MEKYYKSTIVIYSRQNWDGLDIVDMVNNASNPYSFDSICAAWSNEVVSEEQILNDEGAGQVVLDYLDGEPLGDDEYTFYSDDEYEFYDPEDK